MGKVVGDDALLQRSGPSLCLPLFANLFLNRAKEMGIDDGRFVMLEQILETESRAKGAHSRQQDRVEVDDEGSEARSHYLPSYADYVVESSDDHNL